jgi:hypothetical protein
MVPPGGVPVQPDQGTLAKPSEFTSSDIDVRDRMILPLSRRDVPGPIPRFDLGSLFLHLLLFDTVIVPSVALLDIAELGLNQALPKSQAGREGRNADPRSRGDDSEAWTT